MIPHVPNGGKEGAVGAITLGGGDAARIAPNGSGESRL